MGKVILTRGAICCFFLTALIVTNQALVVDVKVKGAKGDGIIDDGPAIITAWKEACGAPPPSSLLFPPGTYMASPIQLSGPCNGPIEIKATGATLKAPPEIEKFKTDTWIMIMYVDKLTMIGGTLDGQGKASWRNPICKKIKCQTPVNLRLGFVKNSIIRDLTSINSKYFHIAVLGSDNTTLEHITIDAPGDSVNTDGIHMAKLNGFNIKDFNIKTGDDCISFGDGCKNIHVEKVACGPGHGISIGSMGKYQNEEPVQGIWIKNCTLTGTDNGVRIKTWPGSYPGTVNDVHFEDITMDKVANPILIDQYYCAGGRCKKDVPSNVKISNVSFRKISGTSKTQVAMKLNCSAAFPCENVELDDIHLTFNGGGQGTAGSRCFNVKPKIVGEIVPPACSSVP